MHYRPTLEEVAEIVAVVQGYADRAFRNARSEGRREAGEAYLADGLLEGVRAARAGGASGWVRPSLAAAGAAGGT